MCWRETRRKEKPSAGERENETTDDEMRDIGISVNLAAQKLPEQLIMLQREKNSSDLNTKPLQCINIGRNNDGVCFHHMQKLSKLLPTAYMGSCLLGRIPTEMDPYKPKLTLHCTC